MVVVKRAVDTWVSIVVPHGLKTGMGFRKYRCALTRVMRMCREPCEWLPIRGLLCSCRIYVDSGTGEYMDHHRSQSGLALHVGSVHIDSFNWDEFQCPRVWDCRQTLQ